MSAARTNSGMWQRRAPSRTTVVMVALLRLLAVLLVGELSGALHTVLDAAASVGLVAHPEDDCDQGDGHECPPGCTSCHCSHGAVAWAAPQMDVRVAIVHAPARADGFVPSERLPPPGVDRARLYRPPRNRAVF